MLISSNLLIIVENPRIMKKILFILLAVIGLVSCKKTPDTVAVPFETVQHYFSITTVTSPTSHKIMDQATFESLFDAGFTMDSQQAPLDFSKEFVIAIVYPVTDVQTKLAPVSLMKENNSLVYTYSVTKGQKMSSTSRPSLLIRVDKKYDAPLQVIEVQN